MTAARMGCVLSACALVLADAAPARSAQADLAVSAVASPAKRVDAGKRVRLRAVVVNRGRGRARTSAVRFYLSTNAIRSSADTLLGRGKVPALAARRRTLVTAAPRVPSTVPLGRPLRLLACAGARCRAARGAVVVIGGSSADRIAADRRAGRLSSENALVYRLFAAFGDPRLPKRYRGDGTPSGGTEALAEAQVRLATLSPRARALVEPFLIPPIYKQSFAARGGARAAQTRPHPCQLDLAKWSSLVSLKGLARVWWRTAVPADAAKAARLANELDGAVWPKLTALMGTDPGLDGYYPCSGTDSLLDIYLLPLGDEAGLTGPYAGCGPGPSWVVLKPSASRSDLAHEFMHVLQHTFKVSACLGYLYLAESTATWAEDFVYPTDQAEHLFSRLVIIPSDVLHAGKGYPGWAYHYSVTRLAASPDSIPAIWKAAASKAPLDALDGAVPGGLDQTWPAFARHAWNRRLPGALDQSFFSWDAFRAVPAVERRDLALSGDEHAEPLPIELRALGKQYYHLGFANPRAREVAFRDPSPPSVDAKLRTHAFVKIAGKPWRGEDWSGGGDHVFCRDRAEEDLREIVLVHATTRRPGSGPEAIATTSDRPRLRLRRRCQEQGPPFLKPVSLSGTLDISGTYTDTPVEGYGTCTGRYSEHWNYRLLPAEGEGGRLLWVKRDDGFAVNFSLRAGIGATGTGQATQTCPTADGGTVTDTCSLSVGHMPPPNLLAPAAFQLVGGGKGPQLDAVPVTIRLPGVVQLHLSHGEDYERSDCGSPTEYGGPGAAKELERTYTVASLRNGSTLQWGDAWKGTIRPSATRADDVSLTWQLSFGFVSVGCRDDC